MRRNSITPSRAFWVLAERVETTILSAAGNAHDACGFGGPGDTSTRHIRQLPAMLSRSW